MSIHVEFVNDRAFHVCRNRSISLVPLISPSVPRRNLSAQYDGMHNIGGNHAAPHATANIINRQLDGSAFSSTVAEKKAASMPSRMPRLPNSARAWSLSPAKMRGARWSCWHRRQRLKGCVPTAGFPLRGDQLGSRNHRKLRDGTRCRASRSRESFLQFPLQRARAFSPARIHLR